MSHIHFTSTDGARERVIAMGEEPWRVHRAGAPSLDHLRRSKLFSRQEVEAACGLDFRMPAMLVAYHPVTLESDTTCEADALFAALGQIAERGTTQILFSYPNADAGSRSLIDRTRAFLDCGAPGKFFVNLDAVTYWSLLRCVDVMLGNSSSGIMETASFALPTVNVGLRQKGRERARNVLDAEPDAEFILARIAEARSPAFRTSLVAMTNPYGDGHASERIVDVLTTTPPGQQLLIKRAMPIAKRPVG
jgi:UDP-N-acetylglucosamine 2-epimerase (non-hydrolysing)/GDP/UDP-N,N'-diacetylbacillosamine 2-epimerase (hydrolysing)